VVEFSTVGGGAAGLASSVAEARERASPFVCRDGANGLIVVPDGDGYYQRATVIRSGPAK
jgi:hypothetical protein